MANGPPSHLQVAPRGQHDTVQAPEIPTLLGGPNSEPRGNEHPQNINFTGLHPTTNRASYGPPPQCFVPGTMAYNGPPPPPPAPDECYACQGNQGVYYPPPGIAQQAPLIPGPLVSMLNNGTIGRHDAPSLPTGNVAGAFQDIPGLALPGTSAAEDLKYLAIRYLRNPDSHVDKLRMKSSRSGGYKVLILLEIDDMM